MNAYFDEGNIRMSEAIGNVMSVYYPVEESDSSIIGMVYIETDTMRMFVGDRRQLEKIWTSKAEGVMYPLPPEKTTFPISGGMTISGPSTKTTFII